ncbi:hypothetical protein BJY52DRAFT_427903 [Lactarius psammicola]|nr:hypothetical protein BJY52DRAFT_427903 [Lactarius psammicola]
MDPSPIPIAAHAPSTQDVPMIKTEERPRPIPAQGQQPPHPPQRVQRYKDKFQTLRERYDTVTSMHSEYTRAVQRATEKEQRLQAEINMLLDSALATTPPPQLQPAPPMSAQTATPTPVHAQLSPNTTTQLVPVPVPVPVPAPGPGPPAGGPNAYAAHAHSHTNGHGHGHSHSHSHSRSHNSHPLPDREHHGGRDRVRD